MAKTCTIDVTKLKETNTFNLKGVSTLQIGTNYEAEAYKSIKARGNTVTLEMFTGNDHSENGAYVTIVLKNCDSLKNLYYATSLYNKDKQFDTNTNRINNVIENIQSATISTPDTESGKVVTGTIWNDTITMTGTNGYTINAGKGNDKITGTTGNDTITGGTGKNTIYYSGGKDTFKLTKDEELTIDLSENNENLSYTVSENKKDLILNVDDNNKIILSNFVKSNGVGAKGTAQVYLGEDGESNPVYVNLNSDAILGTDASSLKVNDKNKTVTYSGTRLGDRINIGSAYVATVKGDDKGYDKYKYTINAGEGNNDITLSNTKSTNIITAGSGADIITLNNTSDNSTSKKIVTTVKAGNGKNKITLSGSGNNTLITGKNDDTFNINAGTSTTTIKAGAGENNINIQDNNFGTIVLAEEKTGAINNISLTGDLSDYKFKKVGASNDLVISNGDTENESTLTIKDYFTTGKKYATNLVAERDFDELLEAGIDFTVKGKGTIKGTNYGEKITGSNTNDKIYAGKGDDIIDAGSGNNLIYMFKGDGVDTISNTSEDGVDTLVFKQGSKIKMGFVESDDNIYDLRIYYSGNKSDYALLKEVIEYNENDKTYHFLKNATSVSKIRVGSKTYTLESLLDRNKIENKLTVNKKTGELSVVGTSKHDDIFINDAKTFNSRSTVIISGNSGSDNIMLGSNYATSVDDEGDEATFNVDPLKYDSVDIAPVVYTNVKGKNDSDLGTFDRVVSYASQDGIYYAQSAINDIKVQGILLEKNGSGEITDWHSTDDTYYANVNNYTKIYDEGGDDDKLYIMDAQSSDLKLIFNITKDYNAMEANETYTKRSYNEETHEVTTASNIDNTMQELKILTSSQLTSFLKDFDGAMGIDIDYWGDKYQYFGNEDAVEIFNNYKGYFGTGVEKITASDGKYITSEDIAQVAENVAKWLNGLNADESEHGFGTFDDVETVLTTGTTDAKNALLAVFNNIEWKSAQ